MQVGRPCAAARQPPRYGVDRSTMIAAPRFRQIASTCRWSVPQHPPTMVTCGIAAKETPFRTAIAGGALDAVCWPPPMGTLNRRTFLANVGSTSALVAAGSWLEAIGYAQVSRGPVRAFL